MYYDRLARTGSREGLRLAKSAQARRPSLIGRAVRIGAAALVLWVLVTVGAVLALRWVQPPVTAMMLAQAGWASDLEYEWVDRPGIAQAAAQAVIAAEDQKFLAHHGFDVESIGRAIEDYRAGDGLRGASTITQQVAKNLFLWPGRSFARKALEAYFALLLETFWPKQRILEVYLNVAELGPGVFGVEAAARRFFATSASRLTARQAALLAAVLPSPARYDAGRPSAYVRGRQTWILGQMKILETRGHYRGLEW